MSAIARFRKRKNLPMVIDVPWPLENPEFVFKVSRFAQMEIQGAMWKAEAIMTERGWARPDPADKEYLEKYNGEQFALFLSCVVDNIQEHTKGWEHTPTDGEKIQFSPANLKILFECLGLGERQEIGLVWHQALNAEGKKKDDSPNTEKAS